MNKLLKLGLLVAMVAGVGLTVLPANDVSAINVFSPCSGNSSTVCSSASKDNAASMVKIVINTLLYILGAIAVVMIVIGGIRYAASGGDSGSINQAKTTVLYAVVGLIVAIMAYSIVNFVVGRF